MSHKGSQQGAHSDSIHMTTYPIGYLSAAWIAFEDIDPDSGPLLFYPGSHRLPYVFSKDVGITESDFKEQGYTSYAAKYEPYIRRLVEEHRIEPRYFHAKKGDALIWHANLVHGGSMRRNIQLSRKALVCHFFVNGAFVYHDLAATTSKQAVFWNVPAARSKRRHPMAAEGGQASHCRQEIARQCRERAIFLRHPIDILGM